MKIRITIFLTEFLSYLLIPFGIIRMMNKRVLHISYPVHIADYTVQILKQNGVDAYYLAKGFSNKYKIDYNIKNLYGNLYPQDRWKEFYYFWKIGSRHKITHSHFMLTISNNGWELKFYKLMGGKWVVHARGCSERDRELNIKLHPSFNICQICDYNATLCNNPINKLKKEKTKNSADHVFVTTPDLKDFMPNAEHLPFFFPPIPLPNTKHISNKNFKIVHVTNHPGIEGTNEIETVINNLKQKDFNIDFIFLKNVDNAVVFENYKTADLSIGKMKMGYYANAQIESLYFGVPAITYIRDEFLTEEIMNSGLIITHLNNLENTLEFYLKNPHKLMEKKTISQQSVIKLHNNNKLALRYKEVYEKLIS